MGRPLGVLVFVTARVLPATMLEDPVERFAMLALPLEAKLQQEHKRRRV